MTMLTAALVPVCAVLLLLIVSAVIAIVYVRKRRQRRSVVFKSMDEVEMKSTNQTEAGLVIVDRYMYNYYKHFLASFIHRSSHHLLQY